MEKKMKSFKAFLLEHTNVLNQINDIIAELSDEELNEFGDYLFDEYFEDETDNTEESDMDSEDEFEEFDIAEIKDMLNLLEPELLQYVLDDLQYLDNDSEDYVHEGVSRVFKKSNANKKKRSFMANTKSDLRKSKALRKRANRTNKASRKRYYRANKQKIKTYQKGRADAIKKGTHHVKLRRTA